MYNSDKVSNILARETEYAIDDWFRRVEEIPDLIPVPLTREERTAHLPALFRDLVTRLNDPLPLGTRALMSDAAFDHGCIRREQGYTPAMLVEESRLLQVTIFNTLERYLGEMGSSTLLLDVMVIADEVDSQLAQTMTSYVLESDRDGCPIVAESLEVEFKRSTRLAL
jgi:hypothetical protein